MTLRQAIFWLRRGLERRVVVGPLFQVHVPGKNALEQLTLEIVKAQGKLRLVTWFLIVRTIPNEQEIG